MTYPNCKNPNERVVKVVETTYLGRGKKQERAFWVIRDVELEYWRGYGSLNEPCAWTRDTTERVEFTSRKAALKELESIWQWRREQMMNSIVDDIEDLAA
ncbi:MAG TPA: hypothetical protein PL151_09620 [Phycisphaerae bacterium]|nr:hypothetical protein [Phycisphaerae bacterium]HOM53599.1 hypothetical protein [Phycisphaerae bacterium]HON68292.1 hypothetical protein [Phycisphaerae bacterium]HPP28957.1 hypothetical protein [Phycisphaerae bacterium]HQA00402.1 hypothetical protein [Phycisphaerae bacterium]